MLSNRGIETITKILPLSSTVVQVTVWYNFQISPFGSYGNLKYSGNSLFLIAKPLNFLG